MNSETKIGISLIMANRNKGEYIEQAIKSILKQNDNRWQLIIVDDASSDNSVEVINSFLPHSQIIFERFYEHGGYVAALKKMISLSDHCIIGTIDSDDVLAPEAAKTVLSVYDKFPEIGFVYSQFMFCDIDLKPVKQGFNRLMPEGSSNIFDYYASAFRTFRKNVYYQVGGFDFEIEKAEDRDLILKMEEQTKFYFIDKTLYYHRILPDSESHGLKNSYISRSSHALAKLKAYRRRLSTNLPNLDKDGLSKEMWGGAINSAAVFRWHRTLYFIWRALIARPLSVLNTFWFLKRVFQEWKHRFYLYKNQK